MKLSFVVGAAAGYVLGTKAGRERYEEIRRRARRLAGSQTVQSTAGVMQAQLETLVEQARTVAARRLSEPRDQSPR